MHRIFYNVDELFIFRKYFTTYHATNSFFSYIFNQAEFFTLQQLSVCKTSGCIAFGEAKFIENIKNKNIRKYYTQQHQAGQPPSADIDYQALETEEFASLSNVPFRLSNNLVDFIGHTGGGLHGHFAGVVTACSLAMGKHHEKLLPLMQLVFRDEMDDKESLLPLMQSITKYVKFKMLSLSQHKKVLNIDQYCKDPEYLEQHMRKLGLNPTGMEDSGYVSFANMKVPKEMLSYQVEKPNILEEYNKKVFDLIEMSTDQKRLAQLPSNWNAWF
ncbi:hypothetical protein FGO68_gene3026 [Halteria grandinella]|uniref:Uncharacterized protein n=1 Tax=Halteria grandinella TaxID=5974 RepID=A0A8J8SVJ0_HALGN|nr:hypothetical protein FGO68_gene3026 [Halteria grandinella]